MNTNFPTGKLFLLEKWNLHLGNIFSFIEVTCKCGMQLQFFYLCSQTFNIFSETNMALLCCFYLADHNIHFPQLLHDKKQQHFQNNMLLQKICGFSSICLVIHQYLILLSTKKFLISKDVHNSQRFWIVNVKINLKWSTGCPIADLFKKILNWYPYKR